MIKSLEEKRVFARQLESSEIAYHSLYMNTSAKPMIEIIKKYKPNPRLRSRKWVSTSVMASDNNEEALKYASAEYFSHNLVNPVYFYDKLKDLPSDAIVLELGPHSVFGKIVTETLNDCKYLSLIKKDSNDTNLDMFLSALATLYELGLNLAIDKLYPPVEWPVARGTQSISSLMRWDHTIKFDLVQYPEKWCRETAGDSNVTVDHMRTDDTFYLDHKVDGNPLFPATGYLMLAWRKLAASVGKLWPDVPVVFENIHFRRAVFLSDNTNTRLVVKYYPQSSSYKFFL